MGDLLYSYGLLKKLDFLLTEAVRRDKRPKVRQRATAIRLLAMGQKPAEVAERLAAQPPRSTAGSI